jgi:uncharacterized protein (TIGR02285 family)
MKLLLVSLVLGVGPVQPAATEPSVAVPGVSTVQASVERIVWLQADARHRDPSLSFIAQRLPQVRHEYISTNAIRSWQMIQQGEPACRPQTVRTAAREKEAYWVDTQLTPPAALFVRRDKLALVPRNSANEVDLVLLLKKAQLRGAIARGRSYGDFVDGVLAQQPRGPYLADYAMQGFGERLQDMLVKGRADFWIDMSGALIRMQMRELPIDEFIALAIQGAPQTMLLSIACPRTPWGLAASRTIDQVLGSPEGAAHLQQSSAGYFDAETSKRLGPQIEQFYQRRSKPQLSD